MLRNFIVILVNPLETWLRGGDGDPDLAHSINRNRASMTIPAIPTDIIDVPEIMHPMSPYFVSERSKAER